MRGRGAPRGGLLFPSVDLYVPDPGADHAFGRASDRQVSCRGTGNGRRCGADSNEYVRRSGRRGRLGAHGVARKPDPGLGLDRQSGRFGRSVDRAGCRQHLHASRRIDRGRLGRGPVGQADARQVPKLHAGYDACDGRVPREGDRADRRRGYRLALAPRSVRGRGDGGSERGRQRDAPRVDADGRRSRAEAFQRGQRLVGGRGVAAGRRRTIRSTCTSPRRSTACWAG